MRAPTVDLMIATAVANTLLIARAGASGGIGAGRKEPCWSIAFARVSRPAAWL